MRMSSWVPANMFINYGLIIAKPTVFNTVIWQWINQTYNAMFNYGNRNASSVYTTKDIVQGYACAVAASITVALGLRKYFSTFTAAMGGGAKLIIFNSISTFFAVSTAGFLNAYLMRQTELKTGIDIFDPTNPSNTIGKSKYAASQAVLQTAISRYLVQVPIMLPSAALFVLEKFSMVPQAYAANLVLQMALIFCQEYFAMPLAVALYPQTGSVASSSVEPSLTQNLQNIPDYFEYNKGL